MHFFDFTPETLRTFCGEHDLPPYLGDQLLEWVYGKGIVDVAQMTNIAKRHHDQFRAVLRFDDARLVEHQSATDGTEKLLLEWPDPKAPSSETALPVLGRTDRQIECVLIPTEKRRTACVSSQIGCPVGCRFCASGLGGLDGNLRPGQIIEQVHRLGRLGPRITNVVFMGMGEPLANYAAVTDAIRTINAPWGLGIGARRITVSTVGLPAAILRLVEFEIPVTLALSLHAPNDDIRRELIPWAEYAPIADLLDACDAYFQSTGREITLEYLLLHGVNDQREHAHELARVAKRLRANVNLIRYNEVDGLPYGRPKSADVRTFQETLRDRGVNAHIRASRGRDIAAACGQLRHESKDAGVESRESKNVGRAGTNCPTPGS